MRGLDNFIEEERKLFKIQVENIVWDDITWNIENWLFHRGTNKLFSFKSQKRFSKELPNYYLKTDGSPLPYPYIDFVKSCISYLKRTKNQKYASLNAYLNEFKRLYVIMHMRGEKSPEKLTRWHFEEVINYLKTIKYKNLYDSATNLKVISNILDSKRITDHPINFIHNIIPVNNYYSKKEITRTDVDYRNEDKLPSYEALKAYAECTNVPINPNEEILLRAIDLLIATGMRVNEVAFIPYDCWVEKKKLDENGKPIKDANGRIIKYYGLRYYAEKKFQDRIHWLASQDVDFTRRAVFRLKDLTYEVRKTARFQEKTGRIWSFEKEKKISSHDFINFLGFKKINYLHGYLKRNGINYLKTDKSYFEYRTENKNEKRVHYSRIYRAGDIEEMLLKKKVNHNQLVQRTGNTNKTILKTSDLLIIKFEGAFRFKRTNNIFKVFPNRILIKEINNALGVKDDYESIFERRNLTESDGSKIRLTSHQPRHWRNTLYELAGLSNVQQALAMGRQNLSQNKAYQHTTIREKTRLHQEYLSFNSVTDKINFLHQGIRNKTILGEMTETYHLLKSKEGINNAESFLKTHGLAIHLTPFGGCTHDFSQSPCQKYLQCWNGCSHLHRTNTPGETERLKEQLEISIKVLKKMKEEKSDEINKKWIDDIQNKIINIKKAIAIPFTSNDNNIVKIFPEGIEITKPNYKKKNSSV